MKFKYHSRHLKKRTIIFIFVLCQIGHIYPRLFVNTQYFKDILCIHKCTETFCRFISRNPIILIYENAHKQIYSKCKYNQTFCHPFSIFHVFTPVVCSTFPSFTS